MSDKPDFDTAAVHRYFSATCFNKTWEFIDNSHRSPYEPLSRTIRISLYQLPFALKRDSLSGAKGP